MKNFKEECYLVLRKVPIGNVVCYKDIAFKLNSKAYRAVGNAMNKNKDRNIPCHRVVKSNGEIGFYNRGIREKIKLLRKEGIIINKNKVNLGKYRFNL